MTARAKVDALEPEHLDPELAKLLKAVRKADRSVRIQRRDEVVAWGLPAVEPMAEWLQSTELAGFAVRVLERIGLANQDALPAVSEALVRAHRDAPNSIIVGDIEEALGRLGRRLLMRNGRAIGSTAARPVRASAAAAQPTA